MKTISNSICLASASWRKLEAYYQENDTKTIPARQGDFTSFFSTDATRSKQKASDRRPGCTQGSSFKGEVPSWEDKHLWELTHGKLGSWEETCYKSFNAKETLLPNNIVSYKSFNAKGTLLFNNIVLQLLLPLWFSLWHVFENSTWVGEKCLQRKQQKFAPQTKIDVVNNSALKTPKWVGEKCLHRKQQKFAPKIYVVNMSSPPKAKAKFNVLMTIWLTRPYKYRKQTHMSMFWVLTQE